MVSMYQDKWRCLHSWPRAGHVAFDVGANIGPITLFLSQIVGSRGLVIALEPQRAIYQLLCANLALNGIGNVRAIHAGAGRAQERAYVPATNYDSPGNFGGVELSENNGEPVNIVTIDSLGLPSCGFIKIDVEGHEQAVIAGAAETIRRFKPALYVENDRRDRSAELIRQIHQLDYVLYWHLPAFYRVDNFYSNSTNLWPGLVSIDMLCLPSSDSRKIEGMRPVNGPDDWPFPN